MNLSFKIARRYIISKKSHNIINIVSLITVTGVVVAVVAIICVLSVLNGFSKMIENTFDAFDPDLQIQPVTGKVFKADSINISIIKKLPGIIDITENLEENALLKYSDRQKIIFFKGVSNNFSEATDTDKFIIDGQFNLGNSDIPNAILGGNIAYELGVRPGFLSPLEIYVPKREANVNLLNPGAAYNQANVFLAGVFSLTMEEYDTQMIIIPIELARKLLNYTTEVSSLDIKVTKETNIKELQQKISKILGPEFVVKDKFEIHKDLYRMLKIEKWITFLILFIIVSIAIFNIVGALSMIIIEKKEDIKTLKHLGLSNKLIYQIFLCEGILIVLIGECLGILIGLLLCLIQEHYEIIKLASESHLLVFNAYPVVVKPTDILIVFIAIAMVGLLAVLYPLRNLQANLKNKNLRNW